MRKKNSEFLEKIFSKYFIWLFLSILIIGGINGYLQKKEHLKNCQKKCQPKCIFLRK